MALEGSNVQQQSIPAGIALNASEEDWMSCPTSVTLTGTYSVTCSVGGVRRVTFPMATSTIVSTFVMHTGNCRAF
eukprot:3437381-Amphidinium_carterae.1